MHGTVTREQEEETWQKTLRVGGGVGSENTTQEILRLQMKLKGEDKMRVKAGGYTIAVVELKYMLYLISLTALICKFKHN